jgi:hypothetical protein
MLLAHFYGHFSFLLLIKLAKYEALAKENASSYINPNNKRVLSQNGFNSDGTPETMFSKNMNYFDDYLIV